MEPVSLDELVEDIHGELLGGFRDGQVQITGAQSDNRKIQPGDVFFAFIGEKTDGHRYVRAALEAGAAGAVVSRAPGEIPAAETGSFREPEKANAAETGSSRAPGEIPAAETGSSREPGDAARSGGAEEGYLPGKFYVKVPDTLLAAGDFARAYRRKFELPVIAVTGSVGKTTMKDMIYSVLSERFRTLRTEANFNNNIGVPRTLLRLDHETQMAVVEMGMNHFGEIDYLVHIAEPTCAVITNIGEAHIGNLGGKKENIFRAKCEIFGGLAEGGFAVMNGDDEFLSTLRDDEEKQAKFHFAWVGESGDCDYRAVDIEDTRPDEVKFRMITPEGDFAVTVPAPGRHMIYPALTAAALGFHFGMTGEEITAGIAHYVPTAMRMETLHLPHNILIYNDTYNANPQSMRAGLTTLANTQGYRHVAVLGDMLELGDAEERLHREIGAFAAEKRIDTLVTVGRAAAFIADEAAKCGLRDVRTCQNRNEAEPVLAELVQPDTAFYFKASHAMALEKLVAYVKENALASR